MDPRAVDEVILGITVEAKLIRTLEDRFIAVGRGPHEGDTGSSIEVPPAELHGPGGEPPTCHQWVLDALDFVGTRRDKRTVAAQSILNLWTVSQIVQDNADACGNRAQLAHRPIAHDTYNLIVG